MAIRSERPDLFLSVSVESATDDSDLRWTVDEARDLELVSHAVRRTLDSDDGIMPYETVVDHVRRHPELLAHQRRHRRRGRRATRHGIESSDVAMIRYCRRCVMPETKPDLFIDDRGHLQRVPELRGASGRRLGRGAGSSSSSSWTVMARPMARTTTA